MLEFLGSHHINIDRLLAAKANANNDPKGDCGCNKAKLGIAVKDAEPG